MTPLGAAAATVAAVAVPIVAIDDTLPRRLARTRGWISHACWAALDDPSASWLPVGALVTVNTHLLARARWPVALTVGAASGLLAFVAHRRLPEVTWMR